MATAILSQNSCTPAIPRFEPVEHPTKQFSCVYEIVTAQILAQLERGVVPWRKPWRTVAPMSLATLKPYRGINVLLLASQGQASPYWLTYQQAVRLGGNVRKGENSTLVTFWKRSPYTRHNDETGEDETRQRFLLRYYRVFNLAQTEGIAESLGLSLAGSPQTPDIEKAQAIVEKMPNAPRFEQSNAAWYRPLTDTVGMPDRMLFTSGEEYYSTLFHELIHSTGHPSRVGREGIENVHSFASESYSKEELVSELGAAFLCGTVCISPATVTNSASYLQSWISGLRGDSRLIVSAASQAQKAADFILGSRNDGEEGARHDLLSCRAPRQWPSWEIGMKAAIYARVSTANNGQDPTMQTRELREYAERRGWAVAGEYIDVGISGTKEKRPELDRLMADAHRRKFDAVVVWKFDRFARSVSHLLRALETFKAQDIEFVSFSEQMDTSTPAGKMVFTVLGAVAELERSLIVERVKAGLRNARAKGKRLGRPRVYPDPRRIATLRDEGLSWTKIAERLGVGEGTVYRAAQASAKIPLSRRPVSRCSKAVE